MSEFCAYVLVDSIKDIIERADECKARLVKDRNDFDAGRLLAFNEVLSLLKIDFTGDPVIERILNFDIDKRYS